MKTQVNRADVICTLNMNQHKTSVATFVAYGAVLCWESSSDVLKGQVLGLPDPEHKGTNVVHHHL